MRVLCAIVLFGLQACVSGGWRRTTLFVPPPRAAIDALEPGVSTLEDCLSSLGAPLYVWEYEVDGVALAYGWSKSTQAGFSVSVPVAEGASAAFSYDDLRSKLEGAVLFFDRELKLELVRRGYLRDLDQGATRRRPAAVPAKS